MKLQQKKIAITLLMICCWMFTALSGLAQHVSELHSGLIRMNPKLRYGKLQNGFTYYILPTLANDNKVFLKLLVKAGQEQAGNDQIEIHHMLEHMAFVKTKNFPNGIRSYTDKQGLKFGNDLNAGANFGSTNYWLNLPSEKPEVLESALHWLRDVAQDGILFEKEKIDNERGVVEGEIRGNSDWSSATYRQYMVELMRSSIYSDLAYPALSARSESVKSFQPASLVRFYKDWYRPDLEAIIVAGDVDPDLMELQIKSRFSDLRIPENSRPLGSLQPESKDEKNRVITVTHPQAPFTQFKIVIKKPYKELKERTDFKDLVVQHLSDDMLTLRLRELGDSLNIPTLFSVSYRRSYAPGNPFGASLVEMQANDNELLNKSIYILLQELDRLVKYGFSEKELQKAKERYLALLQSKSNGIIDMVSELEGHFIGGDAAPGLEYTQRLYKELLKEISLKSLNEDARKWDDTANRIIAVLAPEKEKPSLPDEKMMNNWFAEIKQGKTQPYIFVDEDEMLSQSLISDVIRNKIPVPNLKAIKDIAIKEIGVNEWILPNGVKVLLKPIKSDDNSSKQISIRVVKRNGDLTDDYEDKDYADAYLAASVVANSGLGPYKWNALKKFCERRNIAISPGMGRANNEKDLQVTLQGLYLYFTQPKMDVGVFRKLVETQKKTIRVKEAKNTAFDLFLRGASLAQKNDREELLTTENLDKARPEKVFQIYKDFFSNAADFTFVIVGDFDPGKIKYSVAKYLGALPAAKASHVRLVKKKRMPDPSGNDANQVFYADDKEDKAKLNLRFEGSYPYTVSNRAKMDVLGNLLHSLVMKRIREKEGLDYSPSALGWLRPDNAGVFMFNISIMPKASQVNKAVTSMLDELAQLKANGPGTDVLNLAVEQARVRWNNDIQDPNYWMSYLTGQLRHGKPLAAINQYITALDELTPQAVLEMANFVFTEKHMKQFKFIPQSYKETGGIKEKAKNGWQNLDLKENNFYGISTEKAYREVLSKRNPESITVAVLDSGIDTLHEDLLPVLWKNKLEKGGDEDHNGYIADVYGWNFLGGKSAKNLLNAGFEYQRMYFQLKKKLKGMRPEEQAKIFGAVSARVIADSTERILKTTRYQKLLHSSDSLIQQILGKTEYHYENIKDIKPTQKTDRDALQQMMSQLSSSKLSNKGKLIELAASYRQNNSKPLENPLRKREEIIGDEYDSLKDRKYGNNDLTVNMACFHGTHVAGIIGAVRANGKGVDGVADGVKLMAVRAVPAEGDEYDKDIALGIRYAVDNGAKIINMSFAKPYSPHRYWVDAAIRYAAKKDVLIIKAAGNDAANIDSIITYPSSWDLKQKKKALNMIVVGASGPDSSTIVAPFSNYGKKTVDVFAPGMDIYSTTPGNQYQLASGTSMAAPVVTGLAAMIRAYYPNLSAVQVKAIIEKSVTAINFPVRKPGTKNQLMMKELCITGGIVNAYAAVQLAEQLTAQSGR